MTISKDLYIFADHNYGNKSEWTKPIKALMKKPEALVIFDGSSWIVYDTEIYSPSLNIYFFDRLVHLILSIFSTSYVNNFNHAVERLYTAKLNYTETSFKAQKLITQFINSQAYENCKDIQLHLTLCEKELADLQQMRKNASKDFSQIELINVKIDELSQHRSDLQEELVSVELQMKRFKEELNSRWSKNPLEKW